MKQKEIFLKVYNNFKNYIKYACYKFYNKNVFRLDILYEPEDLAQLVYIALWKYLERYNQKKCAIKTYMILIMHTVFKRALYFSQKISFYNFKSLDYEYENGLSLYDILSLPKENLQSCLEVESYKFHLEPVHKKIWFRIIEQGWTYEQTGQEMGVSREMVRLHIKKIRKKIKRLEGIYED